jgi:hypothetical protein
MTRATRKHGGVHHLKKKRSTTRRSKSKPETFDELLEEIAKLYQKIKSTDSKSNKQFYIIKKKILERRLEKLSNVTNHLAKDLAEDFTNTLKI